MPKDIWLKLTLLLAMLVYAAFLPLAIIDKVYGWIPDIVIFAALTLGFYFTYSFWRLNLPIYTLLIIGFITHLCGILGWYNSSPIPIQWDHITHFFGCLPFAMLFFQFLRPRLDHSFLTVKNFLFFIIIFFSAFGVGALVETMEFWGYLSFGFGPGAFMFGPGDGVIGKQGEELIDALGGGWVNKGWDMTFNFIGILVGMVIMVVVHFVLGKRVSVQAEDFDDYNYSVKL